MILRMGGGGGGGVEDGGGSVVAERVLLVWPVHYWTAHRIYCSLKYSQGDV